MARKVNRLTAKAVANAKPGFHPDGGNLGLQVSPSGAKSWLFVYTFRGRAREMGLGPLHDVSLAAARKAASAWREVLREKRDPIEIRNERRVAEALAKASTISTRTAWERYIAAHRAGWRNAKHRDQWTNTLETYAGPVLGDVPVSLVDVGLVMRVIQPHWAAKNETMRRVRARLESVLDWARVHGYRTGENPARWRGHLDKLLPKPSKVAKVEHHAAMAYGEIGAFMEKLRAQPGEAARALEFLILCAARTGEVIGAKAAEFDLDAGVWTVPASRMKGGRRHRVPLAPRAVEIVRDRIEEDRPYVFAGGKPGEPLSNMAMAALLRRMGRDDVTVHGFRASFRQWIADKTTFPHELAEAALAHKLADGTEAAYQRSDMIEKRVPLMASWARYCAEPKSMGEVTPIRRSVRID